MPSLEGVSPNALMFTELHYRTFRMAEKSPAHPDGFQDSMLLHSVVVTAVYVISIIAIFAEHASR